MNLKFSVKQINPGVMHALNFLFSAVSVNYFPLPWDTTFVIEILFKVVPHKFCIDGRILAWFRS